MNNVVLYGRLTRDPDSKFSTGGNASSVVRFAIAVRRDYKNSEGNYDSDFPSCVAFGKTAEFIEKYFHKGDQIMVRGRLTTGNYTNKDGVKVYTTDVVVDQVEFGGSKNNTEADNKRNDNFMNVPEGADDNLPWNV